MNVNKRLAFCMICGECLGEYRKNCAEEHTKRYPSHNDFLVRKMVDPLLLSNPDEWFEKFTSHQPTGNTNNNYRGGNRICIKVLYKRWDIV